MSVKQVTFQVVGHVDALRRNCLRRRDCIADMCGSFSAAITILISSLCDLLVLDFL